MTQHLAGRRPRRGRGGLRYRCAACAAVPDPRAPGSPHPPGLAFCSKWMVPFTGPSPFSTHTAFIAMLREETRGGLGNLQRARSEHKTREPRKMPQETSPQAQASPSPPPPFYSPGPGHAHPGTEPIVTRGLRPPSVERLGRGARGGAGPRAGAERGSAAAGKKVPERRRRGSGSRYCLVKVTAAESPWKPRRRGPACMARLGGRKPPGWEGPRASAFWVRAPPLRCASWGAPGWVLRGALPGYRALA